MNINAKYIDIHPTARIHDSVQVLCESFKLGENSYIGKGVKITCRSFEAGKFLYMTDNVEVGRGGCMNVDSRVKIGDFVGIFENTVINPNSPITIGDYVGIGCDVQLWTHGAWLDILQGFPSGFGPIKIGSNVWLPARSIVLPNVEIGDDTVITINSVINRSLPKGCLAGGNPAKVIKTNQYPRKISNSQQKDIINKLMLEWLQQLTAKGYLGVYAEALECSLKDYQCGFWMKVNREEQSESREYEFIIDFGSPPYSLKMLDTSTRSKTTLHNIHLSDDRAYMCDMIDNFRRKGLKLYETTFEFKSLPPQFLQF